METIGSKITYYRNTRKWTQEKLASDAGIPQSQLSKIENDSISPRLELLDKIAEALEIPVFNLLPNCSTYIQHNNPTDSTQGGVINNYSNDRLLHELLTKVIDAQNRLIEMLQNK